MNLTELKKIKLPENPGVYFFLGKQKEILYIGKATTLKSRVRSYFDANIKEKRSVVIEKMVDEAKNLEWIQTDSVLEAMLLETNLIRTHKPVYNTKSKDDKSFNHVVITNESYPRVLVVRGKDLLQESEHGEYTRIYGPFPNGQLFREALKILRKLFKFYDTKYSVESQSNKMRKGKIDFNRQIGLYPDQCSLEEYHETILHIQLFFEGKKQTIIDDLTRKMLLFAKHEEFEKAHILKKKILALTHIQDIALIKDEMRVYKDERNLRIEAYDIAHLQGSHMVGALVVLEGGEPVKSEYKKFIIRNFSKANDPGALLEMLRRRLKHTEWRTPDVVVVDGNTIQRNVALKALKECKLTIPVVSVVKNDRHKPDRLIGTQSLLSEQKNAILLANAEAHRFAISFFRNRQKKNFTS